MKKYILFILFLLNLLPNMNIRTGSICVGWSTLSAQQMGNENVHYCNDDEIGWYYSPMPCDMDVCHQACTVKDQYGLDCSWEGNCDEFDFHMQVEHSNYDDDKNDNDKDDSDNSSNNDNYVGGGGGASSGWSHSGNNGGSNNSSNSWSGVNKAIATLNSNASTPAELKNKSKGKCATYVRLALEAGGIDTSGHPVNAKDYGPHLTKWGFHEISRTNYKPQIGDIRVWQNYEGGNPAGHIDMYNGKDWVSDFIKPNPNGPGPQYRKHNNYKIYRK